MLTVCVCDAPSSSPADEFLGVARDEFVKSIKQFLQVESEMYPVFILTMPGEE
jgi:hypothetical protein